MSHEDLERRTASGEHVALYTWHTLLENMAFGGVVLLICGTVVVGLLVQQRACVVACAPSGAGGFFAVSTAQCYCTKDGVSWAVPEGKIP